MALPEFVTTLHTLGANSVLAPFWPVVWSLIKVLCVLLPLMGLVAYATLWERKFIGWIQIRVGPNRVGPLGLLQPIADVLKLLVKEIILPTNANKGVYILAPVLMIAPAPAAWAVLPAR